MIADVNLSSALAAATGGVTLDDRREWWETDGRGGWAASTVAGLNTRRAHSLLTAALPERRCVLFNTLEETLDVGGQSIRFSCRRYAPDVIDPSGYRWLTGFRLDPWPIWRYTIGAVQLEKQLLMRHDRSATIVTYHLVQGPPSVQLRLRLLATGRDSEALHCENADVQMTPELTPDHLTWRPYLGLPAMQAWHNAQSYRHEPLWYRRACYALEAAQGLEATEDYWSSGELAFTLTHYTRAWLVLGAGEVEAVAPDVDAWISAERRHRIAVVTALPPATPALRRLALAAAQCTVTTDGDQPAIVAGYPDGGCRARETLISLPGLLLATGQRERAQSVLERCAGLVHEGMLPDELSGGAPPSYGTVDAPLWFILAVYRWWQVTDDLDIVRFRYWEAMQSIIRAYWRGTRHGIRSDEDGLLIAGDPGTRLTWMDASADGRAEAPRHGKPVEVEALWINALAIMAKLAAVLGQRHRSHAYQRMTQQGMSSFQYRFWCAGGRYLYDVINEQGRDESLRPNQLFAVSLPFCCVTPTQARTLVETVERVLLTPYGLRTLSPASASDRARCDGAPEARAASAYHGAAWPWLLGPFVDAAARVYGASITLRRRIQEWLTPLQTWLTQDGVGSLPAYFDGEPPHAARGVPASAMSTAEVLRLCVTYGIGCGMTVEALRMADARPGWHHGN